MRHRKAFAGETKLLGDGSNGLVGVAACTHHPNERLDIGVGCGIAVRDLRHRNDHHRVGRPAEAVVVGVGYHADGLPGRFSF